MLNLHNLTYKNNKTMLSEINLELPKNASVEIICTDTHTREIFADLLCGIISSCSGKITVCGKDISEKNARENITCIPEHPIFYPEMTVSEYLSFITQLKRLPFPKAEQAIKSVLSATELTVIRNTVISKLNANARARLAFASAILTSAEVIVINNIFECLTEDDKADILKLAKSLFKDKTLVMLSGEELFSELCKHRYYLQNGTLTDSCDKEESDK